MILFRKEYAPGICQYKGGFQEIRWDVIECNLRCEFCWSPASRPEERRLDSEYKTPESVVAETRCRMQDPLSTFIRFTGGEPTLYWDEILEVLQRFDADNILSRVPVLIQTNGIEIGRGSASLTRLASLIRQPCLFELSMKGTNAHEFEILTGKPPELYEHQLSAFEGLSKLGQKSRNLTVVAVLGVYHSSVNSLSKYVFHDPVTGSVLFDHPDLWEPRFREIWLSSEHKWVERLRMSPKGVWKNLWRRCGPDGSGILRNHEIGVETNRFGYFPSKPKSADYAQSLVRRKYWSHG